MVIIELLLIILIGTLVGAGLVLTVVFACMAEWEASVCALIALAVGFVLMVPLNFIQGDETPKPSLNPEVCVAESRQPVYDQTGVFVGCLEKS